MVANGIVPARPLRIIPDGRPHRFPTANNPSKMNGSYLLEISDGMARGFVQDWAEGEPIPYRYGKKWHELTDQERLEIQEKRRQAMEIEEEAKRERQRLAALKANAMLKEAERIKGNENFYLKAKGITAQGGVYRGKWRYYDHHAQVYTSSKDTLFIPVYDIDTMRLCSLQAIYKAANKTEKRYLKDGKKGILPIGDSRSEYAVIAEGYATAVSIYLATGFFTVVAFDANQLVKVAIRLQSGFGSNIIMAADHDKAGLESCQHAARRVGGYVAYTGLQHKGSDFNDLHALYGQDMVKKRILDGVKYGRL